MNKQSMLSGLILSMAVSVHAQAPQNSADAEGVRGLESLLDGSPLRFDRELAGLTQDSDGDGVVDLDDNCPDTPARTITDEGIVDVPVDHCGCPQTIEVVRRQTLDLKFAFASAAIEPAYLAELDQLRDLLRRFPSQVLVLEGHTDWIGSAAYNRGLSRVRAEAVRRHIIRDPQIAPERVRAVGFGEARPIADNRSEEGRQLNRRTVAEFRIERQYSPSEFQAVPVQAAAITDEGSGRAEEDRMGSGRGSGVGGELRRDPNAYNTRPPVRR